MCLILLGFNVHPEYPLIVAGNRDEFYNRPTATASFWSDHPHILGGRDLEGMGTWMGVNTSGHLSMITNYRDLSNIKSNAPTRGRLVSNYLISPRGPKEYFHKLDTVAEHYNGYNLILGRPDDLWYYSNISRRVKRLGSGVYGLSNHLLNTDWPKVVKGKAKFSRLISEDQLELILDSLYDDKVADDAALPDTGVGLQKERMLSPLFIKSSNYGTRTSTLLLVSKSGKVTFTERTYDLKAFNYEEKDFSFQMK